jgi:hypothetical protein
MTHNPIAFEDALEVIAEPADPRWLAAFALLSRHPETAGMVQEAFRETLEEMGVPPSGVDRRTGEPVFGLGTVARTLGVPEEALERGAGGRGVGDDEDPT